MKTGTRAALSDAGRRDLDEAIERADAAFNAMTGEAAAGHLFVPGRIEVLGKHSDYAGGTSLTGAVERGFAVAFSPRADRTLRIADAFDGRQMSVAVGPDLDPPIGQWTNYPMTVARRLARNFPGLAAGADVAFHSTLPRSAGLSTSSALITAVYLVLAEANDLEDRADFRDAIPTPTALAGYLGCIENGKAFGVLAGDMGVGTAGGSQDHTAILLSEAERLASYFYHPVTRLRQLQVPSHLTFVVGASGIVAAKTGDARDRYNRASALVAGLVDAWRESTGGPEQTLGAILANGRDATERLRAAVTARPPDSWPADALLRRLDHFIVEDGQILPAALDAFNAGDFDQFGALVDRSQHAAEMLLGNQVPETIALARLAREHGAIAASSFGAGFGGSVWALIDVAHAEAFQRAWREAYRVSCPAASAQGARFFLTRPGPGAGRID